MSRGRESGISKVFAVPHFHYDVEWWKTEDGYNEDVAEILDRAFELLDRYEDFTYVVDQALALRPYWDEHPEMHEKIRGWIEDGRLEMVGGTLCSPDENIPTGEALVRQYVYGRNFFEDEVGCRVVTGWEIDAFGHPAQYAQIAAGAGMKGFVFARGVQDWQSPSQPVHFMWESPDGTRVLTNWLAAHYIGFTPLSPVKSINFRIFEREMKARLEYEGRRTSSGILMFPFGTDFSVPYENWMEFVENWNREDRPEVTFSLPAEFFAELDGRKDQLPLVRGELNPLLTGCYESRERVKKLCRRSQYSILNAEKWAALAWWETGEEYPRESLDEAWELILENDFHDIVCGTGTDKVYRNTLKRYARAGELIEQVRSGSLDALTKKFVKAGETGYAVFNSLNWQRRSLITIPHDDGGIGQPEAGQHVVTGPDGKAIPCQHTPSGLLFQADVLPMGFSVYSVSRDEEGGAAGRSAGSLKIQGLEAENEYLHLSLDGRTGGLVSIYDKELDREMLDTARRHGNEIVVEEDAGNLWTVQKTGREWTSGSWRCEVRVVEEGPVRVGFEIRGGNKDFNCVRRVYLEAGARHVDFETVIDFKGKDRRVKAVFDLPFSGRPVFETPYYSEPRSPGHHCAQNWVDISNGRRGLAVLNSGNPGTDVEHNSIGIVLMRSVSVASPALLRFIAKDRDKILRGLREAAGYLKRGLGMQLAEWSLYDVHGLMLREWSSAGGPRMKGGTTGVDHLVPWLLWHRESDCWERGAHTFKYRVISHAGGWREANLPRAGWEFNTPADVRHATHAGGSKGTKSACLFDAGVDGALILSALKKAEKEEGLVARFYDSHGRGAEARFKFRNGGPGSCEGCNLVEARETKNLKKSGPVLKQTISAWKIASYLLKK